MAIKRSDTKNIVVVPSCTGTKDLSLWDIKAKYREQGVGQIGSHYVVLRDGDVEKGRPVDEHGNVEQLYNRDSVFIEVLCSTDEEMTEAQRVSVHGLVSYLEDKYEAEELNLIN